MSVWTSPAATAVEGRLLRALAVLRIVVLLNALLLGVYRAGGVERPRLGAACLVLMTAWTAFATWAYASPRRRTPVLLVADLAIAVALLLLTPVVKGPGFGATVPGFWISGALLAWAVHYRLPGGVAAGALLAGVDLALREQIHESNYGNAFLLVVGGAMVGTMCGSLQRMATERDAAERAAAMAAERARLARAVHDGVLQVLALVQRRGGELGPDGAELGRLAAQQERELRALIRAEDAGAATPSGTIDLVAALAPLERGGTVTVSAPAFPVELAADAARELVAAVHACLDNVRTHVGELAPAWVLLEAFPDRVEVCVRDEGPGIPAGRLAEAARQGRLGVVGSIRGRMSELGGTAELVTGGSGTEWQLVLPRPLRHPGPDTRVGP